jgi:hypothetical protein
LDPNVQIGLVTDHVDASIGPIVSEAELFGFGAKAILTGDLAIWRLSSCLRALAALGMTELKRSRSELGTQRGRLRLALLPHHALRATP